MTEKPLVWLQGEVRSPPFSALARINTGILLRRLQRKERLPMPDSRPMSSLAPRCHELRIADKEKIWRVMYRIDHDAIVILEIFQKTTQATPKRILDTCRKRLRMYDQHTKKEK